jgi:NAD+ kinase
MNLEPFEPKRIIVATHPSMAEAWTLSRDVVGFLKAQHLSVKAYSLHDEAMHQRLAAGEHDFLVALGGDGTMLRAGHLCAPLGIPILGINLGRLGFLTEVKRSEWQDALQRVLTAGYWIEPRMMLQAEHFQLQHSRGTWNVLNECVVGRGGMMRPVRLIAEIDGMVLTTFVADSLIAATATGSTGYALAAGGPILPPQLRNILLVPVAPHLSVDRAIVLDEGSRVKITVHSDHQASLSVDGQTPVAMQDGDCVEVQAGPHSALFARLQDPSYFYRNLTSRMNQNPSAGASG